MTVIPRMRSDSDSVSLGSNPGPPASLKIKHLAENHNITNKPVRHLFSGWLDNSVRGMAPLLSCLALEGRG